MSWAVGSIVTAKLWIRRKICSISYVIHKQLNSNSGAALFMGLIYVKKNVSSSWTRWIRYESKICIGDQSILLPTDWHWTICKSLPGDVRNESANYKTYIIVYQSRCQTEVDCMQHKHAFRLYLIHDRHSSSKAKSSCKVSIFSLRRIFG